MTEAAVILADAWRAWEAEVRAGVDGQHRHRPATWKNTPLYAAVCCEANARDMERERCPEVAESWRRRGVEYLSEGV